MYRSGSGLCKLGLRARAEERRQWEEEEEEEEEFDKKEQFLCNAEQAVHLIPFLLLTCLLVLYVFSYTPVEGLVPENAEVVNHVKKLSSGNIPMDSKKEALQTFSVYNHRSLHQLQKKQDKGNHHIKNEQKEVKHPFRKENKQYIRRTRLKKKYFHRKNRILYTR